MSASCVIEHPGWLGACAVALFGLRAALRRRGPQPNRRTWLTPIAVAALVFWLLAVGTTAAHLALWLIGALSAIVASRAMAPTDAPASTRRACLALRAAAWIGLLIAVSQPGLRRTTTAWAKPLLVAALDQSKSMSASTADGQTRAALCNGVLDAAQPQLRRLQELYDVRFVDIGAAPQPGRGWQIRPADTLSGVTAALRLASRWRSTADEPAHAVLLLSDGGENLANADETIALAREMAVAGTRIFALGASDAPGTASGARIDAMEHPARVGLRDEFEVEVAAEVSAWSAAEVVVSLGWEGQAPQSQVVPTDAPSAKVRAAFRLTPTAYGPNRISASIHAPGERASQAARASVVEVTDDRLRALLLARRPRVETAFVARALASNAEGPARAAEPGADGLFAVKQWFWEADAASGAAPRSDGFDVILLLDAAPDAPQAPMISEIVEAVRTRGTGLLVAGGAETFQSDALARSELAAASPVALAAASGAVPGGARVIPTAAGLRGPLRLASDEPSAQADQPPGLHPRPPAGPDSWSELPPAHEVLRLVGLKPLAIPLAVDENGACILAGHDFGAGRVAAAGWMSTWPLALASDAGAAAHAGLWRGLATWLANRRPRAWVATDALTYPALLLRRGERKIEVRAGLVGAAPGADVVARLTLRSAADPSGAATLPAAPVALDVPLSRLRDEWRATLPGSFAGALPPGLHVLGFRVDSNAAGEVPPSSTGAASSPSGPSAAGAVQTWEARTSFSIEDVDLELRAPNANLLLLRDVADATRANGGRYWDVRDLTSACEGLLNDDRRQRIVRELRFDPTIDAAWPLLLSIAALFTADWALRKRAGLR